MQKLFITESQLKKVISEELKKSDIVDIVKKDKDIEKYVKEIAANVLDKLFTLDDIRLYMSHPERFSINDNVQICFNDSDIVCGRHGYETWWSNEYERREKNDI